MTALWFSCRGPFNLTGKWTPELSSRWSRGYTVKILSWSDKRLMQETILKNGRQYPSHPVCAVPVRFFLFMRPLYGTSHEDDVPLNEMSDRPRTAQTKYRKFETNIPRKRTARLQSQFLHSLFLWANYILLWSIFLFCCRNVGGLNVGIYTLDRSQTHECDNSDWGRAITFLGIYKFKFLCSAPMNRRCTAHSKKFP